MAMNAAPIATAMAKPTSAPRMTWEARRGGLVCDGGGSHTCSLSFLRMRGATAVGLASESGGAV